MNTIKIDQHTIGENQPCFLIAEIGQNHDGSLGLAHAFIDAVAEAGFDAIKFQTHIANAESTYDETFRVKFSQQDATRYEYWKRMEFTPEQWQGLYQHAQEKNLVFLSSAFSTAAIELLDQLGIPAWKIGSGEFRSSELFSNMVKTEKPILYSTGMCKWQEIDEAVQYFQNNDTPFALFQCTSMYPTPSERIGLNILDEMSAKYDCPIGLSDHSGKIFAGLAALSRGAHLLEVHATFDKRMFGPDVVASVTIDELALLAEARNEIYQMLRNPVDKDELADQLSSMRELFTKSIAPAHALKAGTVIAEEMLLAKKPGTGIPFQERHKIIGKRLIQDVSPEFLLRMEDLEEADA